MNEEDNRLLLNGETPLERLQRHDRELQENLQQWDDQLSWNQRNDERWDAYEREKEQARLARARREGALKVIWFLVRACRRWVVWIGAATVGYVWTHLNGGSSWLSDWWDFKKSI